MTQMAGAMTGGCQCGAIRYAVTAAAPRTSLCHCRMCQKAVGQPFAAYATVKLAEFAWTCGQPPAFRSSTAAERHFCPACGTSLTFRYLETDEIGVAAGTLDRPEQVTPRVHFGVESRVSWMDPAFLQTLRSVRTDNAGAPQAVAALVNFQHPDHDTPDGWTPPAV